MEGDVEREVRRRRVVRRVRREVRRVVRRVGRVRRGVKALGPVGGRWGGGVVVVYRV